MELDLKIIKIRKIDEQSINKGETEQYELLARDPLGVNTMTLKSPTPFDGYTTNELINIKIGKPQTSLDEFNDQEPKRGRKKSDESE